MTTSPSSSAQTARAALAARLREIRLDAGLTKRELAARCGWHESKSSRIENVRTPPSDADIQAWCRACDAERRAPDLIVANREADSLYVEWKRLQRTGLRRLQESGVPLYESTRRFRIYCSNVVPGVLQTPGYAQALLSSIAAFRGTPDDVADAVTARMARSRAVREGDHRLAILVEETVLRYRLGDAGVMAGQLGHLLSAMDLPSVSLGIIPSTVPRRMWPLETFTVFDDHRVHLEPLSASIKIISPEEIALYVRAFDELRGLAAYGAEARALVVRAIDALG
ncbi:helix-turn-helix domain-containing protein [Streptomyces sp. NPDC059142]|uniref:helix-turn-helix domain-containing protein n=1 Tax=Streptomyces sp. NPDC059142 TaxID=3346739 RepID=UPI00368023ED